MIVLDTSALIRFFTNDIPSKAVLARQLIESEQQIAIPDLVFPELEYVLMKVAKNASRIKVLHIFQYLISRKNIHVSKDVIDAVEIFQTSKLDMADCLIAAAVKDKNRLASFDQQLLATAGKKGHIFSEKVFSNS